MRNLLIPTYFAAALLLSETDVWAQPAPAKPTFSDVPPTHWAYDAVQALAAAGIIEGYPNGEFGSNNVAADSTSSSAQFKVFTPLIKAALAMNSAASRGGTFDVEVNGTTRTVTLNGTVSSLAQSRLAANIAAKQAPGFQIINQLKVVQPAKSKPSMRHKKNAKRSSHSSQF